MGVIGVGHLGKWHIQNIKQIPDAKLVGFYDSDPVRSKIIAKDYDAKSFPSLESLLKEVEAVSIVVPTKAHYDVAISALDRGVHTFCEKPFMQTIEEADEVIRRAKEKNLLVQVGHIERFNPALSGLKRFSIHPLFIESHRISSFNPRGTDVAVVLDLMIHDIDIVLSLVNSPIRTITAAGAPVLSNTIDIANARIQFENGCVANLTASRVSNKQMRKLRIFQERTYISIDFLKNTTEVFLLSDGSEKIDSDTIPIAEFVSNGNPARKLLYQKLVTEKSNAMLTELTAFVNAIQYGTPLPITGEDGKKALEVALQIESQIQSMLRNLK